MSNSDTNVTNLDRINLRLSGETLEAIDGARSVRAGRISRNTWIAEAIKEKLARDIRDTDAFHHERTGNA